MTAPYRSTPVFNEDTLPAALRARHSTREGVWGMVRVLEGRARLTYLEPGSDLVLEAGAAGPLLPGQPHFVEPIGAMKLRVDFYREPPSG